MSNQSDHVVLPRAAVEELRDRLHLRGFGPAAWAINNLLADAKGVVDDGTYTVTDTCGEPGPDAEIQIGFDYAEVGNTYRVLLAAADVAEEEEG